MSERIVRPTLERSAPIRNWSAALAGAGQGRSPRDDLVSRSVELGYRVIDEYVRQGQKAARRLGRSGVGGPAMIADDLQQLGARMAQYASEFFGMWFQMMGLAMANGGARPPVAAGEPPPAARAPTPRARIRILSPRLTEVSLDLEPDTDGRRLRLHPLATADRDKPELSDISVEPGSAGEPPCFRIHVPPGQPAGIYSGLVLDVETGRPVGTLCVRIVGE